MKALETSILYILAFNLCNAREYFILFIHYVLYLNVLLTKQLILHFQKKFLLLFIFKCFSKKIIEKL